MSESSENPNDNIKPQDWKESFGERKTYSKYTDPCKDAAAASLKCMDRNGYDREQCMDFFDAYKECRKTWVAQRRDDRMNKRTNL